MKYLGLIAAAALELVKFLLDHYLNDRRTTIYHRIRSGIPFLILISLYFSFLSFQRDENSLAGIRKGIDEIGISTKADNSDLKARILELKEILSPIKKIVDQKYSGMDASLAISRLASEFSRLDKQIGETQRKTDELVNQVGFRVITSEQERHLISDLKKGSGMKVCVVAPNASSESTYFAEQIRKVFLEAGWKADPVLYKIQIGMPVPPGIELDVPNPNSKAGMLVQSALRAIKYDSTEHLDPSIEDDAVNIFVGQKS